jgi:hypothetical protein
MNRTQAAVLAARIVSSTGSGWNDVATAELTEMIGGWVDPEAADIAVTKLVRGWTSGFRPAMGTINEAYVIQFDVARARKAIAEGSVLVSGGCDGTRYRPARVGSGSEPCPRCNPYLSDLFADRDRWKQYLDGVPLFVLHDGVTRDAKGGIELERPMPPACARDTTHDPADAVVSPNRGYDIALRAYLADCELLGIEPDFEKFHAWMGPLVGEKPGAVRLVASTKGPGRTVVPPEPPPPIAGTVTAEEAQAHDDAGFLAAIQETTARILGERDE